MDEFVIRYVWDMYGLMRGVSKWTTAYATQATSRKEEEVSYSCSGTGHDKIQKWRFGVGTVVGVMEKGGRIVFWERPRRFEGHVRAGDYERNGRQKR
jgi:hypothetical protein